MTNPKNQIKKVAMSIFATNYEYIRYKSLLSFVEWL